MSMRLTSIQWGIVAATAVTALIHLFLGFQFISDVLGVVFILNGLGYLVLVVGLYFVPQLAAQRSLLRWVLLGYTAVTFVLYFVFNGADSFSSLPGLITKVVELALMALLWLDRSG
jgi:hypothetical protein